MLQADTAVRISDDLRMARDLFGYHLHTKTEHVFIRAEDMIELVKSFGQWLDPDNETHLALVFELTGYMGLIIGSDSGGALDE